jgi:hypothetical protein
VRTQPRPGEPAGRPGRQRPGRRPPTPSPRAHSRPKAAQPQRRARHAASRSHTEWPTTTASVMSTSSRSAAARNRSGSGLAWPPGPASSPARRRTGTWRTSRVGHAASGSPLVAPPTAPAGCSGAAAAGGRRAVAAPSRRGAHMPRHGLAGAGRPGRRRPAAGLVQQQPTTGHRFIPMRRWIRHTDSSIPPASNASCQASTRWETPSTSVPSRSNTKVVLFPIGRPAARRVWPDSGLSLDPPKRLCALRCPRRSEAFGSRRAPHPEGARPQR